MEGWPHGGSLALEPLLLTISKRSQVYVEEISSSACLVAGDESLLYSKAQGSHSAQSHLGQGPAIPRAEFRLSAVFS